MPDSAPPSSVPHSSQRLTCACRSCQYPQLAQIRASKVATSPASAAGRHLDAGHLVALALVVDERPRAELADRDEPGPLQVAAAPPLAGHVGGQRQARERVAGQEALAGEVAVAVEVAELLFVSPRS